MILDLRDMIAAAREGGYALPVFDVAGIALARSAVETAAECASPVVIHPTRDADLLMPAVVALANRVSAPVAPVMGGIATVDHAAEAIRLGAHGLILADGHDPAVAGLAEACGVALLTPPSRRLRDNDAPPPGLAWFGDILAESSGIPASNRMVNGAPIPWTDLVDIAANAARGRTASCIARCGSSGRLRVLEGQCRRRREVDHVVLYNAAGADDAEVEAMVREGVRQLGAIPGVRRVFAGRAVGAGARYTHAWVVRFSSEGVIALYRDHPAHVAFADGRFRPLADDRMTIDFIDER
ncbi:MAG: Dabb family protein [Solirubrobacterales bacterium]